MASPVEQKVKQIIVEQLGVDESQVENKALFVDDLGADSLDIVELVMAFEEAFELEIPDEDAEKIATVKDAIDYIEAKTAKKKPLFSSGERFVAKSGHHWRGLADAAGDRNRVVVGRYPVGQIRHRPYQPVRCVGLLLPHRRRSEGF